jgi:hypothetical protein
MRPPTASGPNEVGVDAFLTKPADVPLLLQTIADLTGGA